MRFRANMSCKQTVAQAARSVYSVGGLETLYCFEEHPEMFDAYVAISPSLWWDKGSMISETEAKLKRLAGKNKFLFLADSPETGPFPITSGSLTK
jgi:enterochelin esterase-like enzyme